MSSTSTKSQRVAPLLSGDEARYRRRYRALKELVNELSDESNLLALRVHDIQRRLYDEHMKEYGRPPPAVPLPDDASWAPLVGNADAYPDDAGKPLPLLVEEKEEKEKKPHGNGKKSNGNGTLSAPASPGPKDDRDDEGDQDEHDRSREMDDQDDRSRIHDGHDIEMDDHERSSEHGDHSRERNEIVRSRSRGDEDMVDDY